MIVRVKYRIKCDASVLILELKGSVRHVQKGNPTSVTQVDLIL